jgi:hypothetical protein
MFLTCRGVYLQKPVASSSCVFHEGTKSDVLSTPDAHLRQFTAAYPDDVAAVDRRTVEVWHTAYVKPHSCISAHFASARLVGRAELARAAFFLVRLTTAAGS